MKIDQEASQVTENIVKRSYEDLIWERWRKTETSKERRDIIEADFSRIGQCFVVDNKAKKKKGCQLGLSPEIKNSGQGSAI